MIRIYDTREWGYGLKGDGTFTYENQERIPKSLFPVWGAVQPEVWYPHVWEDPLSGFWQRWSVICTPQIKLEWAASRDDYTSSKDCADMFKHAFENIDTAIQNMRGQPEFKLSGDTYQKFGQLFTRMEEIKTENATDPVVLAEGNKILRETLSTMGLIHALEQGANGAQDFEVEIPLAVFERASAMVNYHKAVALRGRPPKSVSLQGFNLKLDDTPESVRLRKIMLCMRGSEMSGTDLKKNGALDGYEAAAWRKGPGQVLAQLGLLTTNGRSNGWSISRQKMPCAEEDEAGHKLFTDILSSRLNMTPEEYAHTFDEAPRQRGPAGGLPQAGGVMFAPGMPASSASGSAPEPQASIKQETAVKEEHAPTPPESVADIMCLDSDDEPPPSARSTPKKKPIKRSKFA